MADRLADIPPDGQLGRHPAWRLRTALTAIRSREQGRAVARPRMPVPKGALILEHVHNPVHAGMVMAALDAIYSTTWFGRYFAMEEGCGEDQAERIGAGVSMMLIAHYERTLRDLGVPAFQDPDVAWLQPECAWWMPGRGLREDLALPEPEAAQRQSR